MPSQLMFHRKQRELSYSDGGPTVRLTSEGVSALEPFCNSEVQIPN